MVAVGMANGKIKIINVKTDHCHLSFSQKFGCVTSLSFRSDDRGVSQLVSGSLCGNFVVWDLDNKKMHHVEESHKGPISKCLFLPGHPLLVTAGHDNALTIHIFDSADDNPRIWKERRGFPGPVTRMKFYDENPGTQLIVSSEVMNCAELGMMSIALRHQDIVFSQKNLRKAIAFDKTKINHLYSEGKKFLDGMTGGNERLTKVIDFDFSSIRHYDWANIVSVHENSNAAYLWSLLTKRLELVKLKTDQSFAPICAVSVSYCGHFCILGLADGTLHRFNIQSGQCASKLQTEVQGSVTGIRILPSLEVVVCGSADEFIHILSLKKGVSLGKVELGRDNFSQKLCVGKLEMFGGTLCAFVSRSNSREHVEVLDLVTKTIVRSFPLISACIDLSFSSDGKWLAIARKDARVEIADLPSARIIDIIRFFSPVQALCFSPNNAYLLTSHFGSTCGAVHVWSNKYLFDPSSSAPLLRGEPQEVHIDAPPGDAGALTSKSLEKRQQTNNDQNNESDEEEATCVIESTLRGSQEFPLESGLLTLSSLSEEQRTTILQLDLIKERNKASAKETEKKKAPFFIPVSYEGVKPVLAMAQEDQENAENKVEKTRSFLDELEAEQKEAQRNRRTHGGKFLKGKNENPFESKMQRLLRMKDYDGILEYLKAQTASGVHLALTAEIGSMAGGDAKNELVGMSAFFKHHLEKGGDADLIQVYLSLFLQIHGTDLSELPLNSKTQTEKESIIKLVNEMAQKQADKWTQMDTTFHRMECFLKMLTQTQTQW